MSSLTHGRAAGEALRGRSIADGADNGAVRRLAARQAIIRGIDRWYGSPTDRKSITP